MVTFARVTDTFKVKHDIQEIAGYTQHQSPEKKMAHLVPRRHVELRIVCLVMFSHSHLVLRCGRPLYLVHSPTIPIFRANLSYLHVYEWKGEEKVKQAHHTSVPSNCDIFMVLSITTAIMPWWKSPDLSPKRLILMYTVKPVRNDRLYNKIYCQWFIQ